jgi:hypothetical protein
VVPYHVINLFLHRSSERMSRLGGTSSSNTSQPSCQTVHVPSCHSVVLQSSVVPLSGMPSSRINVDIVVLNHATAPINSHAVLCHV